ncbi:MAG TPA: hypothetical protein VGK27_01925 [Candidatus Deferrimicrobiaceae bacterium]|jgi:hypothetical protein
MDRRFPLTPPLMASIVSASGASVVCLVSDDTLSPKGKLVLMTLLLTGYLAVEVGRLRARRPERWMLNPAVFASFLTIFLQFCVGNALFLMPEEKVALVGLLPDVTPAILKLMLLVVLGAAAMWTGYWSGIAGAIAKKFRASSFLRRVLRPGLDIRPGTIVACLALSLVSRLLMIRLGIYGYSSDIDRMQATVSFKQYLGLAESLGKFALLLLSLRYFDPAGGGRQGRLLVAVLTVEVLFGFLSGFKGNVAMPFVIVGIGHYLMRGTIPWRIVAVVPLAIVVAYAVIEPFRIARYSDDAFVGRDVGSIADTMIKAAFTERDSYTAEDIEESAGTGVAFLARVSMTQIASLGVAFADETPLPPGSPRFMADILLAPVYAVVPRALWQSKEMSRHGLWYVREVMGIEAGDTSVGMSPFTYLYFAGGAAAVVAGFFFIGMAQRQLADVFIPAGGGGLIVFLFLFRGTTLVDSVFYSVIIEIIRMGAIGLAIQYLVLRAPADPAGDTA